MSEQRTEARASTESVGRQHELRDLSIRTLFIGLGALTVLVAVSMWLMAMMFRGLDARSSAADPPPSPLIETGVAPPQPRLENVQGQLRRQLHALEQVQLTTYGWIDRNAAIARIPVERAMEILASEGLPTAPAAAAEEGTQR